MSLIATFGRSALLRTLAQNRAMTIESAPRSSKKLLVLATVGTPRTLASTAAYPASRSAPPDAAAGAAAFSAPPRGVSAGRGGAGRPAGGPDRAGLARPTPG